MFKSAFEAVSGPIPVAIFSLFSLLAAPSAADTVTSKLGFKSASSDQEGYAPFGQPYPQDGVLFGTPPDEYFDQGYTEYAVKVDAHIIAEFEVANGWVRFVDEGDSVSTVVKGGRETFEAVAGIRTVGELFDLVSPGDSTMPWEIARVSHEPLDRLIGVSGDAEGPTFEQEFKFGHDDWADNCSVDALDLWEFRFRDWHGLLTGEDAFSTTDFYDFGTGSIGKAYGYFSNMDEIWFAVCKVTWGYAHVRMEQLVDTPCNGSTCAAWESVPGTFAVLGLSERYLYHNHSIYSPRRRGSIESLGENENAPWQYFISGAGMDAFEPDDQLTSE